MRCSLQRRRCRCCCYCCCGAVKRRRRRCGCKGPNILRLPLATLPAAAYTHTHTQCLTSVVLTQICWLGVCSLLPLPLLELLQACKPASQPCAGDLELVRATTLCEIALVCAGTVPFCVAQKQARFVCVRFVCARARSQSARSQKQASSTLLRLFSLSERLANVSRSRRGEWQDSEHAQRARTSCALALTFKTFNSLENNNALQCHLCFRFTFSGPIALTKQSCELSSIERSSSHLNLFASSLSSLLGRCVGRLRLRLNNRTSSQPISGELVG